METLKRSNYLASKGLTGDKAEFIAFKAGKMVDDKTAFEQAVDALTADRKKTTFDWTAPLGGDFRLQIRLQFESHFTGFNIVWWDLIALHKTPDPL